MSVLLLRASLSALATEGTRKRLRRLAEETRDREDTTANRLETVDTDIA